MSQPIVIRSDKVLLFGDVFLYTTWSLYFTSCKLFNFQSFSDFSGLCFFLPFPSFKFFLLILINNTGHHIDYKPKSKEIGKVVVPLIANADIVWPPEMDDICKKMLGILMFTRSSYRFNELERNFRSEGIKETRPTIIEHLNHLIEKKLVVKTEVSSKEVWYSFNWDLWGRVDESILEGILTKRILQEKMEKFNKLTIDEQIEYVHNIDVVTNLLSLKDLMEAWIDPKLEAVYQSNLRNYDVYRTVVAARLIENCNEFGIEYAHTLLDKLNKLIDEYFNKELSPTNPNIE